MVNLSVIIINYKSLDLIRDCLRSIESSKPAISLEIIIVNNDDLTGGNLLLSEFPGIRWIDMHYNAGFARANNEGIRQAAAEVVLILNPDTIIPMNALDECYRQFIASEYVACGVQLLNEDRSPQISGNYFVPGGLNYLLPLPYTGKFIKTLGNLFSVKAPHVPDSDQLIEVDWINGAFLMVRQSAIQKAGLMDEDFFLYAEEAEWCARLKKVGKLCIFGNVKVFHLQGISSNEAFSSAGKGYYNLFDKKGKQIILSNLVRIRKQYGPFWFLFDLFIYSITIPIFLIGILVSIFFPKSSRIYNFSDWVGFNRNMVYLWSKTPRILSGRPYFYKAL
ncbi:MAG TPA: glycosyltransferase family 2 protein [Puia sp.]|nr:glycosyltransferase family 2 protein [Puia sp.]